MDYDNDDYGLDLDDSDLETSLDPDSIYGSSDQFSGSGREGEYNFIDEQDDAADLIAKIDGQRSNEDVRTSGVSAADLQTHRYSHSDENTQRALLEIAGEDSNDLKTIAAKEQFRVATGVDVQDFVKSLDITAASPVKHLNPADFTMQEFTKNGRTSYRATASENPEVLSTIDKPRVGLSHRKSALGMMINIEAFETRGGGSQLSGNFNREEGDKRGKAEEKFLKAVGIVDKMADRYIDPRTREYGGSVYANRKAAVVGAITERLMDGTFYEGSKSLVPLPNELGILGLKATRTTSYIDGNNGTTAFTRLQHGIEASKRGWVAGASDGLFYGHMGSAKNSLFKLNLRGLSKEGKAEARRTQAHEYSQFQDDAERARKIFRQQLLTNTDETEGQLRSTGWHRVYDEQARRMNALNESKIDDLDYIQPHQINISGEEEEQEVVEFKAATAIPAHLRAKYDENFDKHSHLLRAQGSYQGGAYGEKDLSEVDVALEKAEEEYQLLSNPDLRPKGVPEGFVGPQPSKEIQKYSMEGIEQRTPEWYKARKGMITASKLIDEQGKMLTSDELTVLLARDRLGAGVPFVGNAYTKEGELGEKVAKNAFLNKMRADGDTLFHSEVGLLQNRDHPGFGASPDGRLTDAEGNDRGLLELKFLSSSSMAGALKKYTPQMQLQMGISGAKETHFFAYDRLTNESIHEVVSADKEMQDQIFSDGSLALGQAKDITAKGTLDLEKQNAEQRRAGKNPVKQPTGQTESFTPSSEVEEEEIVSLIRAKEQGVGLYDTKAKNELERKKALRGAFSSIEAMKEFELGTAMNKDKDKEIKLAASDLSKLGTAMNKDKDKEINSFVAKQAELGSAMNKDKDKEIKDEFDLGAAMSKDKVKADREDAKAASDEATEAAQGRAKADREATKATMEFRDAAKGAIKNLASLGLDAHDTAMETIRSAASEAGTTPEEYRGTQFALQRGNLSQAQSKDTLKTAGSLQKTLQTGSLYGPAISDMMTKWGSAGLNEIAGPLPSGRGNQVMPTQEWISMAQGYLNKIDDPIKRSIAADILRVPHMAVSVASQESLMQLGTLDAEGHMVVHRSYEELMQYKQTEVEEVLAATGAAGGKALGALEIAAENSGILDFAKNTAKGVAAFFGIGVATGAVTGGSAGAVASATAITGVLAPVVVGGVGLGAGIVVGSKVVENTLNPDWFLPENGISKPKENALTRFREAAQGNKEALSLKAEYNLDGDMIMPDEAIASNDPIIVNAKLNNNTYVNVEVDKTNAVTTTVKNDSDSETYSDYEAGFGN